LLHLDLFSLKSSPEMTLIEGRDIKAPIMEPYSNEKLAKLNY